MGRPDYVQAAVEAAEFCLTSLRDENGRLLRSYKDGQAKFDAYLEDHAYLADGLLALYQATFDVRWLEQARALADEMLARFWDEEAGGFFDTASDHADQALIIRPKNITDNAPPSGNAVAAAVLLDLAILEGPSDGAGKKVDGLSHRIPLLAGRTQINGAATAYVCENKAWQLPVTEPAALLRLLGAAQRFIQRRLVCSPSALRKSSCWC